MAKTGHRIDRVGVENLLQLSWEGNPKTHDIDSLRSSIRRFGFVAPVVFDEGQKRIVAGHGRVAALAAMKKAGEAAPVGVEVVDGEWRVPVVRGVRFESAAEARAYLLADNQLTIAGGWDNDALASMLREIEEAEASIENLGFDDTLLAKLGLRDVEVQTQKDQSDELTADLSVLIECDSQEQQDEVLALAIERGWKCRTFA